MTEKIKLTGLCNNCLNADDCCYRINQTKPIIFCEEFSCDDCGYQENHTKSIVFPEKALCPDPPGVENKIIRIRPKVHRPTKFLPKGICCNCENRETCALRKTSDIVINCEEYRYPSSPGDETDTYQCYEAAEEFDKKGNYVFGADIAGFKRVANTIKDQDMA